MSGKYRVRTWLRGHVPGFAADRIPKGADCGNHEWYRQDETTDACYHCEVTRPSEARVPTPAELALLTSEIAAGSDAAWSVLRKRIAERQVDLVPAVTLTNAVIAAQTQALRGRVEDVSATLSETQLAVLEIVKELGPVSSREIARVAAERGLLITNAHWEIFRASFAESLGRPGVDWTKVLVPSGSVEEPGSEPVFIFDLVERAEN